MRERHVVFGPERWMELAVCDHDRCPWKYRGASSVRTLNEAEAHVRMTGHEVTLQVDKRMTLRAVDAA
jgi:hypothetical protein